MEIFTCVRYQLCCQQDEEIGANIKKMGRWNVLSEIPKLSTKGLHMPVLLFSNFMIIFLGKEPVSVVKSREGPPTQTELSRAAVSFVNQGLL